MCIRDSPNLNEPGKALAAADGLYEFLNKKVNGHTDINNGKFVYPVSYTHLDVYKRQFLHPGRCQAEGLYKRSFRTEGLIPGI